MEHAHTETVNLETSLLPSGPWQGAMFRDQQYEEWPVSADYAPVAGLSRTTPFGATEAGLSSVSVHYYDESQQLIKFIS